MRSGRWNAGEAMMQDASPTQWECMVRLYKACPPGQHDRPVRSGDRCTDDHARAGGERRRLHSVRC